MWLSLSDSFFSIVESPDDDAVLLVRARRQGDIQKVFPDAKVTRTPGRDYLFRAFIQRETVAEVIAEQVMKIGYGNFKDSVADNKLHNAYSSVWGIMSRLQPVPPYSARRNGRQGDLL